MADRLREIGLDVRLDSTTYNLFQKKVDDGAYQMFFWGWMADYPDPENFLFLLTCDMRRSTSGGPNYTNFCDERFDALFERMGTRDNDETRLAIIREMREILERERPWIELFHGEAYALVHGWLHNVKPAGISLPASKYVDVDPELRHRQRQEWNQPVLWPAWALVAIAVVVLVPGVVTFLRERQ
jgi:ABC-type oligopeptide transport system substrate-binding subunit